MLRDLFRQIGEELKALTRALRNPGVPKGLRFMGRAFVRWPVTVLSLVLTGMTAARDPDLRHPRHGRWQHGRRHRWRVHLEHAPRRCVQLQGHRRREREVLDLHRVRPPVPWRPDHHHLPRGPELPVRPAVHRRRRHRPVLQGTPVPRVLERRGEGHLTEADVTCAGQRRVRPATYNPPLLLFKFPLATGSRWTGQSPSASRVTDYVSEVQGTQTLSVPGHGSVLTCIVKTTLNFSGDQNGQRQETWYFAPSLGVPVKWSEQTSASESGASFTQNATWTLTSAP